MNKLSPYIAIFRDFVAAIRKVTNTLHAPVLESIGHSSLSTKGVKKPQKAELYSLHFRCVPPHTTFGTLSADRASLDWFSLSEMEQTAMNTSKCPINSSTRGKSEINHIFSFLEMDYKLQMTDHPDRTLL